MKRIFGFSNKSHSQSRSSVIPRRDSGIDGAVAAKGYRLQDKELGKLHKAASIGDIAKVQRLLRKNDPNEPDKLNRTPLHIACASGYPDVVSLLVERNCKLNLCDGDNRTPLIKAVQCQQEECATILLSHGADPNVVDTRSNTALHYSALGHNRAIAAKLVEHKGDIEAKNQEGYTPLLLAITEHNKEMVDFFLKNGANVNACDNSKRTALMIAVSTEPTSIVNLLLQFDIDLSLQDNYGWTAEEYALVSGFPVHRELILQYGQRQLNQLTSAKISSPDRASDTVFTLGGPALDKEEIQESPVQTSRTRISGKVVEESSPEDSISRFSDKPGPDDSWPTSDEEELDFSTQKLPKPNLKKLINASQQIRTNGANDEKGNTVKTEHRAFHGHNQSDSEKEDVTDSLPKPSSQAQYSLHPVHPLPDTFSILVQKMSSPLGINKEELIDTEEEEKKDGALFDNENREQIHHETSNILSELQAPITSQKCTVRRDMLSALGLEDEEDTESPWDSECTSESLPKESVIHVSAAPNQAMKESISRGSLEDYPKKHPNLQPTQPTLVMKDSFTNQETEKGVMEKEKSDLLEEFGLDDADDIDDLTQESEFEGSSEESQENFDKSDQEEVEEEKKKHLHNEMETLEERSDEKLNINKMIGKDNLANKVSDMKDIQHGKDEENKIPGEEIPKMNISNSKESSTPMHHLLECNDSAMNLKYVKKPPSDKWISEDPGITSSCEKVNSLTSILLQVHDDSSLSEDLHEGRPGNETLNKTNKDKGLMDADDLDDLTQSSDTATLDDDLPPSSYKTIILLIEQLSIDCKDSISLLKIQDAVLTYERSLELKKGRCTLLAEKVKSLENKITGLQEELSETREVKSQLEHQKVEWDRELCSLRFTLKQEEEKRLNSEMLFKKISEQLRRKEKQYIKEVEIKEQLELTLRSLHLELKAVRNNLKQVEEERNETQRKLSHEQSARALQDGILSNHFWKQKEAFEANVSKMNQSCEVPDSHEKDLQKNHTLQDEIAMLKLELDAVKIKNQEKENRYTEENEVLKEKNDELQKELKLNEEALTKTVLQYSGQLNVLTTENAMLNSKLKNEKQNRDRVEIEIESYRSRLTSAILDHERSQTSKLDLEHTFQRERDEWLRLQDKLNYDLSSLKDNNGVLSQQLSKAESKANSLENELHLVRDSLREKTLILESTQRDLNQAQYQAKELEHTNQIEKEKLNKYVVKQESMQERFAQIQSENMLLRQQLEDAQNKGIIKEKVVSDVQVQFSDLFNKLRADSEKQVLMVEERNKELINECNHLKEQMCKYENEKAEREVTVRQLQQELADSLKKQSMSEASLEVTSRYRNDLEDKKQQLQKEIDQIKSKLQESEERHLQSKRSTNELEDHIQKLEIENARLEATVKQQMNKIEQIQQNMLDATSLDNEREKLKKLIELKQSLESRLDQEIKRNGELQKDISGFKRLLKATKKKLKDYEKGNLDYQGRMKHACSEEDGQINRLKNKIDELTQQLEDASSKCIHLESMNRGLQEELFSLKTVQKKCDRLEKNKKQLEEEIANLKHHLEIYTLERSQVEQYKREIEERARQEIVEKLKEVNLFLQTQAASQENLEQLRENNNASIRNQMEHRIRDLESELSKLKNSQQDSTKAELEIYRQLYSEELKTRKSLSNKLERTNERLAEVSAELLNEKQRSKTLITSFTASPVLEPPHIGNLNNSLVLNRGLIPRGNIVYSTGNTVSSRNRAEAYFTKMQQELEKNIARELNEATGELESGSCWPSPIGSTDESSRMSNVNQDPVSRATQEYIEVLKKNYML
ncbi:ankyrin repeat domain-containing protein 26 isoform X20 [Monodelphis domestica]|uniref:ankyrin repeat domain-containing protein 26 isoform X20 n=1 Tax=Monodelphis domestica TaxID=13616 RepID=UPI0024E1CDFA|nr:ankyrin repeat domain-containing protein 26 isoform X20 [Monodelphis domestica]